MRSFYDSIDIYVCSSSTEGNNNSLMEAAAMGRAIITTDTGTVPEYLKDGVSARIVERELAAFVAAVIELRDDPHRREAFGVAARAAVVSGGWDWSIKLEEHRTFLRAAVARAQDPHACPVKSPLEHELERARDLLAVGSISDACDALRRAVTMRPGNAPLALQHARVLKAVGAPGDALLEVQRVLRMASVHGALAAEAQGLLVELEGHPTVAG